MSTTAPVFEPVVEEWIRVRREIIQREGCAVRAGAGRTIEVQLVNRPGTVFMPLFGPDGVNRSFASEALRDEILRRLQGGGAAQAPFQSS